MSFFPSKAPEKVRFAMAITSRFFANNAGLNPTIEKPITLPLEDECGNKYNREEVLYIWTAFVLFTQKIPNINFDIRFVRCESHDPSESEWGGSWFFGTFPGFLANSLYETRFKSYLTRDMFVVSKYTPFYSRVSGELSLKTQKEFQDHLSDLHKRKFDDFQGEDGNTKLMAALTSNDYEEAERLINAEGVTPYVINTRGKKPLDLVQDKSSELYFILKGFELLVALMNDEFSLVHSLLISGNYPVNFRTIRGVTALNIAVEEENFNMVKELLSFGANPYLKNKDNKNALDLCKSNDIKELLEKEEEKRRNEIACFLSTAQAHQVSNAEIIPDYNLSFLYYMKAAKLGANEALAPLECLCEEMRPEKQLELSIVLQIIFNDFQRSLYWTEKSKKIEGCNILQGKQFLLK
tara:strand:+ start:850 stop:2076 length:1227 start_codon:yes stop_codon:yes gene_type:complete